MSLASFVQSLVRHHWENGGCRVDLVLLVRDWGGARFCVRLASVLRLFVGQFDSQQTLGHERSRFVNCG